MMSGNREADRAGIYKTPAHRRQGPRQRSGICRGVFWIGAGLVISGTASADFQTVINSPPDVFESSGFLRFIDSNTQVNLYPGGVLPLGYSLGSGWESADNIEINLLGGSIGEGQSGFRALRTSSSWAPTTNVTVNLVEGDVWGSVEGSVGALVTLTSANVHGDLLLQDESTANVSGGQINGGLLLNDESTATVSGGQIGGRLSATDESLIHLTGGTIGDSDGSSYQFGASVSDSSTLLMSDGAVYGSISANNGSFAEVSGGSVGGGVRSRNGSLVRITGGDIGGGLMASEGSSIQLSGGTIGVYYSPYSDGATVNSGSTFLMSNGVVNGSLSISDSFVTVSGGSIEGILSGYANSVLNWSGGSAGPLHLGGGSRATLTGGDFRLDGVPVEGLSAFAQPADLPKGSVLTGVLSDGTPFAITETGYLQDSLLGSEISLQLAPIPASEPRSFTSSSDLVPAGLQNGQTLLMHPGGVAPRNFTALTGSTVTIAGGEVGDGFAAVGATVSLTDGRLGNQAILLQGATMQVSGGEIGSNFEVGPGSRLEIKGGNFDSLFVAHPGSEVLFSGGKIRGTPGVHLDSSFTVTGGEFKVDGVPIGVLSTPGSSAQFDLPPDSVLSGTLSDGTPFVFGQDYSSIARGTLTLQATDIPAVGPAIVRVPSDPVPPGLRMGQTLLLSDGGDLGDDFTADAGSVVRMNGGRIGNSFQAVASLVNVNNGEVGGLRALFGSVVNLNGGVTDVVVVQRGAVVNITGGEVRYMHLAPGGQVRATGGKLGGYVYAEGDGSLTLSGDAEADNIQVAGGTLLTIAGGLIHGSISASLDAQVSLQGGRLGDGLHIGNGAQATIRGFDFRLDGVPLPADMLGAIAKQPLDLPTNAVLSGVFSDGTPFAFSDRDGDYFEPGVLSVAPSNRLFPAPIIPGREETPRGLRPGQHLRLEAGDDAGKNFTAGWESKLTITGGVIGDNFEAVGAEVNLAAGSIGNDMDVFFGTVLNVNGGSIGDSLAAHRGSVVNITSGMVPEVSVHAGAVLNVSGGTIGQTYDGVYRHGRIYLEQESELNLFGSNFYFNGEVVEGLEPGSSLLLDLESPPGRFGNLVYSYLSATLSDGTPFGVTIDRSPWDNAWGSDDSRRVTLRLTSLPAEQTVPEPSTSLLAVIALLVGRRHA